MSTVVDGTFNAGQVELAACGGAHATYHRLPTQVANRVVNDGKAGRRRIHAGRLPPLSKPLVTIAVVAAGLASVAAYLVLRDVGGAAGWGVAVGVLVAGADPRWFLSAAIVLLLLPPLFLMLEAHSIAENTAGVAFHVLALGIGLEFRHELVQRVHHPPPIHSVNED